MTRTTPSQTRVHLNPKPIGGTGPVRTARGKFAPGNKAALGRRNPHAAIVSRLRCELLDAIGPAMVRRIVKALFKQALSGNVKAAGLLLSHALGPPTAFDVLERIDRLEARLDQEVHDGS